MRAEKTKVWMYVGVFLVTGTAAVILGKATYQTEALGRGGHMHYAKKPWFQNLTMFLGMVMCLPYDWYLKRQAAKKKASKAEKEGLLDKPQVEKKEEEALQNISNRKLAMLVAIPGALDMTATYMMNTGLLWLRPSVWQMTRGSIVVWTALIRLWWLKRKTHLFEWLGVVVVCVALAFVGLAGFLAGEKQDGAASPEKKLIGMALVIIAQAVQALQTVVEERLLHDVQATAAIIVGFEGLWGTLLCLFVGMPLAQWVLHGIDGDGLHEDTIDTFIMLGNSVQLLLLYLFYILAILVFNLYGMLITEVTHATTRNILESVRTFAVWGVGVLLFYAISKHYGESWMWPSSYVELAGFVVLMVGLGMYYGWIKFPCLKYPYPLGHPAYPDPEG